MKCPTTKAELLAWIDRGPTAVQLDPSTKLYRVSVPEDPSGGVWLSLSSDGRFELDKFTPVFARVGGRDVRLTRAEASEIRGVVAAAMRLRTKPWHYGSPSEDEWRFERREETFTNWLDDAGRVGEGGVASEP